MEEKLKQLQELKENLYDLIERANCDPFIEQGNRPLFGYAKCSKFDD